MNKFFGLLLLALVAVAPISTGRATLVTLPSPVFFPGILGTTGATPALSAVTTVTSVGHYYAVAFSAREDMTISHVGFRGGVSSGSPTIEVRIETLDPATGLPSGTLWGTNTNGTTGTLSSNTDVLQALTASATITKGQVFCVKLALASGTSQGIANVVGATSPTQGALPYQIVNVGTPAKQNITTLPILALGSSSTTFYQVPGVMPISAYNAGTFNNTNSAKRGMRFTIPMNARAIGLRFYIGTSVGDFNAVLYDDAGNELSSSSTAFEGDNTAASPNGIVYVYFDNTVTLTAGTAYRIAIEPSTSTNTNVSNYSLPSSSYRSATPAGTVAQYTSFTTSTWTDSTTQIPLMDLIIDQVDNGAGSGGGGGRIIGGFLLNRDLNPASNDNSPVWVEKAA